MNNNIPDYDISILKADENSDIPLETASRFFFMSNVYLKLARSMSWLISFARANSSCEDHGS